MIRPNLTIDNHQSISQLVYRMREDWNSRAREDARFFVAFGERNQSEKDFNATATDVVRRIRRDLPWLALSSQSSSRRHSTARAIEYFPWFFRHRAARSRRFLEIGCGIGRLMQNLADECGESTAWTFPMK